MKMKIKMRQMRQTGKREKGEREEGRKNKRERRCYCLTHFIESHRNYPKRGTRSFWLRATKRSSWAPLSFANIRTKFPIITPLPPRKDNAITNQMPYEPSPRNRLASRCAESLSTWLFSIAILSPSVPILRLSASNIAARSVTSRPSRASFQITTTERKNPVDDRVGTTRSI